MIRPRIISTLFRKDIVDGLRESRVLISLLTPIILAVLYNTLFPEDKVFEAKVAYAGPENSAIVQTLVGRAESGQSVSLKLQRVASADEARRLVASEEVDVAFVLPADVDDAIKAQSLGGKPSTPRGELGVRRARLGRRRAKLAADRLKAGGAAAR